MSGEEVRDKSLFCCPVCSGPLLRAGRALRCAAGHSFDLAAQGYVNLLPANKKHSAAPGDGKEMVAARRAFLEAGWYAPFSEALCRIVPACLKDIKTPVVLDAGCGEGYYTGRLAKALGPGARIAAFDISKEAVRLAAQRYRDVEFAVAGVFDIPAAEGAMDCLVNIFAPMAQAEFLRVLRPGGFLLYAVPGPRHLFGLKSVLYEQPYENPVRQTEYPGFRFCRRVPVAGRIALSGREEIRALFAMTPYYWKTPRAGAEKLEQLDALQTEIEFDFLLYQKK